MVALAVQVIPGVLEVPWDQAAQPAQSDLVFPSFLVHPEPPETKWKINK